MRNKIAAFAMAVTSIVAWTAPASATPGFIALEGSDATAFHQDASYTPQLFHYLQGPSSLNVLVYESGGAVPILNPGGVGITYTNTLTGIDLSLFSALYVESPGGCCTSDPTEVDGFGVAINAFIAAGGNFSIENYMGGSFDGVVPGGLGHVAGDGTIVGVRCSDGEIVNALGTSKGFTQPPIDGCWSHQGYELSYWSTFGYVDLIDSATDATDAASGGFGGGGFTFGDESQIGSSLLALGGTLGSVSGVPEPLTLSLFGAGLAGVVAIRRRRKK